MKKEIGSDYKVVLVIGNGFDIDLGLKTAYHDFLESPFFLKNIQDKLPKKQMFVAVDSSIGKKIESPINLFNHLSDKKELKKWIDIETELANLATRHEVEKMKKMVNKASEEEKRTFYELHSALCDYLESIDYGNIDKESKAISLLKKVQNYDFVEIISFNYTDLHKLEPTIGSIYTPIDHVHGSVLERNIILGFQDGLEVDRSYCFMIKSFSQHYKSHNVRKKLSEADEIIFFGHSLGDTDYHYFQDLFKTRSNGNNENKDLVMRIFTYNESSRQEILYQLREMNEKRVNVLYDLCDFEIYRTGDKKDSAKIDDYLYRLELRLKACRYGKIKRKAASIKR